MFRYYVTIGMRNLRRSPVLTTLMVLTLAVGVAASVSTLTILHLMSGDPLPHKSARIFIPLIDNGAGDTYVPGEEPRDKQISYRDAVNLLASGPGRIRAAVYRISLPLESGRPDLPVEATEGLAVSSGWFRIFGPPLRFGSSWSDAEDKSAARVVVVSRKLSEKLFGADNPVGRTIRLADREYKVAGVLDSWNPMPRYSHLINGAFGAFGGEDDIYIPFSAAVDAEITSNGSTSCSSGRRGAGYQGLLDSECTWIQFWFETGAASERGALLDWLNGYVKEQRRFGRMERPVPARVFDVREWMTYLQVISNDTRLAVWLSFGFLLLCLVNTVGLLLAKFSVRAPEVGVRRALGATRSAIFGQFLVEAGVVGVIGGATGLGLALASLTLIGRQSRTMSGVVHMDVPMLATTFVLAIVAALLAGLLPTWRAAQVTPALQLKSQ